MRRITENPDEIRLFIVSRFRSLSPTSYWLRWLYPAWWKYVVCALVIGSRSWERKTDPSSRFLLKAPNAAGIGDQIVTSWSETYMLARQYALTFVHHPFLDSPHDNCDWESFLGFGIGEIQAQHIMKDKALKTVWLPPVSLANQYNISLLGRIINQVYPQNNTLFRLATNVYFNTDLDQSGTMPAIYSQKYQAARRKWPLEVNFVAQPLHIGVHVRRGDVSRLKETNTQQWKWRWVSDAYYLNVLRDLLTVIGDMPSMVHIFSDGREAELHAFNHLPHCVFHLHDDPKRAFHGLLSADVLVSNSSAFSICAGKISSGVKLIGRDFEQAQFRLFVPQTPDWIRVESDGHLSHCANIEVREQLGLRNLYRGRQSVTVI